MSFEQRKLQFICFLRLPFLCFLLMGKCTPVRIAKSKLAMLFEGSGCECQSPSLSGPKAKPT